MTALFLSTSSLQNHYQDCCNLNVSDTIERDCLSVLHKLHDQVNGLQLVQVVVQPLARLFNPASMAALASQSSNLSLSNPSNSAITGNNSNITIANSANSQNNQSKSSTPLHNQSPNSNNSNSNSKNNDQDENYPALSTYMMSPDTAQALIARLDTDRDVNWLMEIIGYGLSMPFSLTGEQDSVKDCCTIYLEWLSSSLLPFNEQSEDLKYKQLSKLVPTPIRNDPNRYARKILSHLYNVFLPRPPPTSIQASHLNSSRKDSNVSDSNLAALSRQAVLCHRVLRTLETTAQNQYNLMDNETWNHLLALMLTINNKLLSPPTQSDIGTHLQDRILGVLFDLMLFSSAKNIPSPNHWKTFHEMSLNWRHRPAIVEQWRRVTMMLTKKLVQLSSQNASKTSKIRGTTDLSSDSIDATIIGTSAGAIELAVSSMNYDILSQTWYRFLSLIGSPIDLTNPSVISGTDSFYNSIYGANDQSESINQHLCSVLPHMFHNTMLGLKDLIETFLGRYEQPVGSGSDDVCSSEVAPLDRLVSKRGSVISLSNNISNLTSPSPQQLQSSAVSSSGVGSGSNTNQSQSATPTQARKVIKSITMKSNKVLTFNSSGPAPASQSIDNNLISQSDHPKSGSFTSSSRFNDFNQPRPSLTSISSRSSQQTAIHQQSHNPKFLLSPDRPKCNSILHLFGDWLFGAALIGSDLTQAIKLTTFGSISKVSEQSPVVNQRGQSISAGSGSDNFRRDQNSRAASFASNFSFRDQQVEKQWSTGSSNEKSLSEIVLSSDSFEAGQSEAIAILCRIFSSKSLSEDISPNYLSRFYLCIQHCLSSGSILDEKSAHQDIIKEHLLSSVLINSTNLLSKDLDGINILIPSIISAIEYVFECNDREPQIQPPSRQHSRAGSIRHSSSSAPANSSELRRSCISTLLNLLAYPYHFQDLPIRSCLNDSSPTTTFASLRPRLIKLLFIALQTENDPINMQILFGGISLATIGLATHYPKLVSNQPSNRTRSEGQADFDIYEAEGQVKTNICQETNSTSQGGFIFGSSDSFVVKALHVTCHQLINIWKHDTQVSLAALELLTMIARISANLELTNLQDDHNGRVKVNLNNNNYKIEMKNEYNQATKWICDYICSQCSRPPPAHSRDMHSTIVAAYQCLSVWISNHPYLLNDEDCVNTLMEVIELGVSGQKSKTSNADTGAQTIIGKGEKVSKPSSKRVKEAAEALLNICMVQSKNLLADENCSLFKNSLMTECNLVNLDLGPNVMVKTKPDGDIDSLEAYKLFRYFSDEDSIIYGFLEGNQVDPSCRDSVVCLIRTPFGRSCFQLHFTYYSDKSREKVMANKTRSLIKRPFSHSGNTPNLDMRTISFSSGHNKSLYFNNNAKFFPDTIEYMPPDDLDKLVETLDDYVKSESNLRDSKFRHDLDKISKIFSHQVSAEQNVMSENLDQPLKSYECDQPQPTGELDAVRIIVAHLNFKTCLRSIPPDHLDIPRSFIEELKVLDSQPVKICDLISIFYVRKNRTTPAQILESVRERRNVSLAFFEWLFEIGHPISVRDHPDHWATKLNASSNPSKLTIKTKDFSMDQLLTSDHGGCIFDCRQLILAWNDCCQELAFTLPHQIEKGVAATLRIRSDPVQASTDCDSHSVSSQQLHGNQDASSSDGSQTKSKDTFHDQSFDGQSLCSVTSDASSRQSARTTSVHSSPLASDSARDGRDDVSRSSFIAQKKRVANSSLPAIGCDTNIMIYWLESIDDFKEIPIKILSTVAESGGTLIEDDDYQETCYRATSTANQQSKSNAPAKSRDYAMYFICPLKNGLYQIHLQTSFGRQNLALPLVDGTIVSKRTLSGLIRESILNLCRRRRLDADCYQPPHVRRRLKILDICNSYKSSSQYESSEYHRNLFKAAIA